MDIGDLFDAIDDFKAEHAGALDASASAPLKTGYNAPKTGGGGGGGGITINLGSSELKETKSALSLEREAKREVREQRCMVAVESQRDMRVP